MSHFLIQSLHEPSKAYFFFAAHKIAAASTTRKSTTMIAPYAFRAKKDKAMLPVLNKIDVIIRGRSLM